MMLIISMIMFIYFDEKSSYFNFDDDYSVMYGGCKCKINCLQELTCDLLKPNMSVQHIHIVKNRTNR